MIRHLNILTFANAVDASDYLQPRCCECDEELTLVDLDSLGARRELPSERWRCEKCFANVCPVAVELRLTHSHEDQLIAGLCVVCDKWGETHGTCVDCRIELDDEDADKEFIHEGHDNARRCGQCHEDYEGARRRAEYVADVGEWYANFGRRGRS